MMGFLRFLRMLTGELGILSPEIFALGAMSHNSVSGELMKLVDDGSISKDLQYFVRVLPKCEVVGNTQPFLKVS